MKRFSIATRVLSVAALTIMGAGLAGCGGGAGGGAADSATTAKGPIKIWYSNNEFEVKWGKAMVESWNAAHPDEKIDAQEIPAGKSSEEVIGAAITAGNAPCLVFNTAPVAVPQFQKQGGLVALDSFPDGAQYIKDRTGDLADQYKSARRQDVPAAVEVQPRGPVLQQGPLRQGRPGPGEPQARHAGRIPGHRPDPGEVRSRRQRRVAVPGQ